MIDSWQDVREKALQRQRVELRNGRRERPAAYFLAVLRISLMGIGRWWRWRHFLKTWRYFYE